MPVALEIMSSIQTRPSRPFHHAGVRRDVLRERHLRAARGLRPSLSSA